MMRRTRQFVRTTVLGGLIVILPSTIFLLALKWLFGFVTDAIKPITDVVVARSPIPGLLADLIVILVIITICFLVGLFVRTRLGHWLFESLERGILHRAPGYKVIKETVNQFLGKKESPFSSVALVQLFGSDTLATGFVTDRHENGMVTVFIPTGPNPTSGQIFHLRSEFVHPVDTPVEEAMRSIISCGAGSESLIKAKKG